MLFNKVIENKTTDFKIDLRLQDPTLLAVEGLNGSEIITFDLAAVTDTVTGIIDPTVDSNWIALINNGTQISMSATNNYMFIQAPAYYRLVLSDVPSNPIKIMKYIYK
tara:strand:+ start:196 stop:519 length:324 start_codon:yes stop_codon:yes gene_type:complete